MHPIPTFSLATPEDFPSILALQEQNLRWKLPPEKLKDGFLSIEFTAAMLAEVIEDLAIVTAKVGQTLAGYRMAQSIEFNRRFPLVSQIIDLFPQLKFHKRPLSSWRTFISGPYCVAEEFRGRGILEGLFDAMCNVTRQRYEVGVTFISSANPRSLKAAQSKLHYTPLTQIKFNENEYVVLAFPVVSNLGRDL